MKILIGSDVDPILPARLSARLDYNIWTCLDLLDELLEAAAHNLPPITWLIRSDESVRFASGRFDSGFLAKPHVWNRLLGNGHELGWHMHLASFDRDKKCVGFDPEPGWLKDSLAALSVHFDSRATRTGWDYSSNFLFDRFEEMGIAVDFSALPGNLAWHSIGPDTVVADWSRCPDSPYHPNSNDYQRPGSMRLLEIPISRFPNSTVQVAKRVAWRLAHRSLSMAGLTRRTRVLTEYWSTPPILNGEIAAFYFHPENLHQAGVHNFLRNIETLRRLPEAEFVTASAARRALVG